jgi:hypothetical protein
LYARQSQSKARPAKRIMASENKRRYLRIAQLYKAG